MILETLHMENFKSHRDTTIDFQTGVTTVMGENGAGKSSIFEALSFVLFKTYTSRRIEQLIHTDEEKMSVELSFRVGGRTYIVRRSRKKTSRASLSIVDESGEARKLVEGDSDVTSHIEDLLEMDGELFLNAVYVRQGEISDLIEKTPAEKKQMIGRLLGIDGLERAWKQMKHIIETYDEDRLKLEGKLESLPELVVEISTKEENHHRLEGRVREVDDLLQETMVKCDESREKKAVLDDKATQHDKFTSTIIIEESQYNQNKEELGDLEGQLTTLAGKEEEIEQIKPELARMGDVKTLLLLNTKISDLEKEKANLVEKLERIGKYTDVYTVNEGFFIQYNQTTDCITKLEGDLEAYQGSQSLFLRLHGQKADLEGKIQGHDKAITEGISTINRFLNTDYETLPDFDEYISRTSAEIRGKLGELTQKIRENDKIISSSLSKNENLKKPLQELEKVRGSCPICQSPISPEKREELIEEYESKIQENQEAINTAQEDLSKCIDETRELESNLDRLMQTKDGALDTVQRQVEAIATARVELENLNQELTVAGENCGHYQKIRDEISTHQAKLRELEPKHHEYIAAKGVLESLGSPEELEKQLGELQEQLRALEVSHGHVTKRVGELPSPEAELERLGKLQDNYQRLNGEVSRKPQLILKVKHLKSVVKGTETHLDSLRREAEALEYDEEVHERVRKEFEFHEGKLHELDSQKHSLTGQLSQLSATIGELKAKEEQFRETEKTLVKVKDFIKLLNFIRDVYGRDGVQRELRSISRPLIEEKTRELFERFNFEYSDIQLDNEYNLSIFGPGGESTLDMISGGERIAVALALRLAITQVLSGTSLELILLDEPTIHLDSYRRQELVDLLKKMSILPQMIIVTHDPGLEEAADCVLRVEKESGESVVEEVTA